ncbi:hypothetical protein WJX81_006574 [Elliptochloris bilobata]|uniref:Uncharacterized protein n=1 Tax=Elliptochloris bilobata TaxID=381761 RepID=A0AAW1SGI9_9CHLO
MSQTPRVQRLAPKALFGRNSEEKRQRELDKEEAFKAQAEVLKRRRGNTWQKDVSARRALVKRYNTDPEYKKKVDEDKTARFKAEQAADPPISLFDIILPIAPFGIPDYEVERFDLKGPYCDSGYVDEDADFGKQVARFFGFGKKQMPPEDPKKGKAKGR